MKIVKTPYGNDAVAFENPDVFLKSAKGFWQMSIAVKLSQDGYVTDRQVKEALQDEPSKNKSKYIDSYRNLIKRIKDSLPEGYTIFIGKTGPRGGFGYWISNITDIRDT
jgi:hypothetical protein